MKLSKGTEWSIHICTFLAALPEGQSISGTRLAEFFDLPKPYLAKHLQALAGAGLLAVNKGPGGGYFLAKHANDISVYDVLETIGEAGPSFVCKEIRRRGPSAVGPEGYSKPCGIATAMHRADKLWADELKSVSIASLAQNAAREINAEQMKKTLNWFKEIS